MAMNRLKLQLVKILDKEIEFLIVFVKVAPYTRALSAYCDIL